MINVGRLSCRDPLKPGKPMMRHSKGSWGFLQGALAPTSPWLRQASRRLDLVRFLVKPLTIVGLKGWMAEAL